MNAPQKLLHIVPDLDLGGLQRVVSLLIKQIDPRRFEPYLCCLDKGGMFYEELTSSGIEGHILYRQPGPLDLRLLSNLYRLIRANKIDVIHSHNSSGLYAGLAGRLAGVRTLIHTDHGRIMPDRIPSILEDRFASHLHNVTVGVSKELTEYLAVHVRIPRQRLRTIINCVDTALFAQKSSSDQCLLRKRFNLAQDDLLIGSVSRFDPIKNLTFLISCMPQILRQFPNTKLILVGEGPCHLELENSARALGLTDQVKIWTRRPDIETILPLFDLYACSSISEGTSMAILEAMACGLPIIASAVGGNCSLVSNTHGILFPLNSTRHYIDGVISLLSNASHRKQMGQKGRQRVETTYSLTGMVEHYQSLYEELSPHSTPTADRHHYALSNTLKS